jgi:hypothetical protein
MEIAKDEFKTIQNNLKDGNQGGGVGTNNNYLTLDDGAIPLRKKTSTSLLRTN